MTSGDLLEDTLQLSAPGYTTVARTLVPFSSFCQRTIWARGTGGGCGRGLRRDRRFKDNVSLAVLLKFNNLEEPGTFRFTSAM